MASDNAHVSSDALHELNGNLTSLSETLQDIAEMMNTDMYQVGEEWRDQQYDDFMEGFKPHIKECEDISKRYSEWCTKVLSHTIEKVEAIESVNMNSGAGSPQSSSATPDGTTSGSTDNANGVTGSGNEFGPDGGDDRAPSTGDTGTNNNSNELSGIGGSTPKAIGIAGTAGAFSVGAGVAAASATDALGIDSTNRMEGKPVSGYKDTDFESQISEMSKEELRGMEIMYQNYSDLAGISAYSYHDGAVIPEGWEDLGQKDPKIQTIIDDVSRQGGKSSGLKFSVLKKTGEEKFVVAFAGTDFPTDKTNLNQLNEFIKDGRADYQGTFSPNEKQIKLANDAVTRLCRKGGIPLEKLEFTGHSLGGRLAAEASVHFGRPATTFNAAGVDENTRKDYENLCSHSKGRYLGVRNVVSEHDILTNAQTFGSGVKNEYIAALPKEKISVLHDTISGTLSSPTGKIAKRALDMAGPLGTGTSRVIDGVDTTVSWVNRFNKYYNRDYRALGGTLVLPDGKSGISGDAHKILFVKGLIDDRHQIIKNRIGQ